MEPRPFEVRSPAGPVEAEYWREGATVFWRFAADGEDRVGSYRVEPDVIGFPVVFDIEA